MRTLPLRRAVEFLPVSSRCGAVHQMQYLRAGRFATVKTVRRTCAGGLSSVLVTLMLLVIQAVQKMLILQPQISPRTITIVVRLLQMKLVRIRTIFMFLALRQERIF